MKKSKIITIILVICFIFIFILYIHSNVEMIYSHKKITAKNLT